MSDVDDPGAARQAAGAAPMPTAPNPSPAPSPVDPYLASLAPEEQRRLAAFHLYNQANQGQTTPQQMDQQADQADFRAAQPPGTAAVPHIENLLDVKPELHRTLAREYLRSELAAGRVSPADLQRAAQRPAPAAPAAQAARPMPPPQVAPVQRMQNAPGNVAQAPRLGGPPSPEQYAAAVAAARARGGRT